VSRLLSAPSNLFLPGAVWFPPVTTTVCLLIFIKTGLASPNGDQLDGWGFEQPEFSVGELNRQGAWHSKSGAEVAEGGLDYRSAGLVIEGGSQRLAINNVVTGAPVVRSNLDLTPNVLYLAFTFRWKISDGPPKGIYIHLSSKEAAGARLGVSIWNARDGGIRAYAGTKGDANLHGNSAFKFETEKTYRVVAKLELSAQGAYNKISIIVNPTDGNEPEVWSSEVTSEQALPAVNRVVIQGTSSTVVEGELFEIDNVIFGESYESVCRIFKGK